jgi:hypothetical protein
MYFGQNAVIIENFNYRFIRYRLLYFTGRDFPVAYACNHFAVETYDDPGASGDRGFRHVNNILQISLNGQVYGIVLHNNKKAP